MTRLRRFLFAFALLALLSPGPAVAQLDVPPVPSEFLLHERRVGERIVFCVNTSSILAEFDRAVAELVGEMLLVEAEIFEIRPPFNPPPLDYRLDISEPDLFIIVNNRCDVLLGYVLIPDHHFDWLTPTRPYVETRHVMAQRGTEAAGLDALPAGASVGTLLAGPADAALRSFVSAHPGAPRWRRQPYPDNALLLERLADGTLDAVLIWEPALTRAERDGLIAVPVAAGPAAPVLIAPVETAMAVKSNDDYLRQLLDTVIAAMQDEGRLEALIREHGLAPRF